MAFAEKRGKTWRVRYRLPDGSYASEPGFSTKSAALEYGRDMESRIRRTRRDPRRERVTLAEWVDEWWTYQGHLSEITRANYEYLIGRLLAEFGDWQLGEITWLAVRSWARSLPGARRTAGSLVSMLSMLLSAAVDDNRLAANPLYRRSLGYSHQARSKRRRWITAGEAEALAAAMPYPSYALAVRTAFWTGMRYGEIAGLHRENCGLLRSNPTRRVIAVVESLHQHPATSRQWLGKPKTAAAQREIDLPPFLADALAAHLASHDSEFVFTSPQGYSLRRQNFGRAWGKAAPAGFTFHGLRHSHKTLLDELGVPESLKRERMGHAAGDVGGLYSHVTPAMRERLLADLQSTWTETVGEQQHSAHGG